MSAQQRSLEIESFHSQLVVHEDGGISVTETIRARFTGSWNGLTRWIPVEYRTERGLNYTLRLRIDEAYDANGTPLRIEGERRGRNRMFRIWVPGAEDATRTVTLRYHIENGLRFFDEYDELYWNVTGEESEVPILSASAEVYVPEGATGIRTAAFTGAYGSTAGDASADVTGNLIRFETTRPLGFHEGLTVSVGWDPGLVVRPTRLDKTVDFLQSNVLLLLPMLGAGLMFGLWRKHGRDPELRPIAPQYEPPDGMTPAELGTLIDGNVDVRDVTSTIVDLAVRGFIEIEETTRERLFGLVSSNDYLFKRVRRDPDPPTRLHEQKLLRAMFGSRDEIKSSDLENSFYRDLPGIRDSLRRILVGDGYYRRDPRVVQLVFVGVGIAVGGLVAVGGGVLMSAWLGRAQATAVIAGFLTAAVIIGFGLIMPKRTIRGTRMLEHVRGFREFLQRVEADRFERVVKTPEMFERFLPYAMALGVEKNWATAFDDIVREPPSWYTGANRYGFMCHAFASDLNRMSVATGSAMQSQPRSSSGGSSFSGGGGFSGGGFGGGGVGGF